MNSTVVLRPRGSVRMYRNAGPIIVRSAILHGIVFSLSPLVVVSRNVSKQSSRIRAENLATKTKRKKKHKKYVRML